MKQVATTEARPPNDHQMRLVGAPVEREFLPEVIEQVEVLADLDRAHREHERTPAEIAELRRATWFGGHAEVGA
jgi:hypothetical protein